MSMNGRSSALLFAFTGWMFDRLELHFSFSNRPTIESFQRKVSVETNWCTTLPLFFPRCLSIVFGSYTMIQHRWRQSPIQHASHWWRKDARRKTKPRKVEINTKRDQLMQRKDFFPIIRFTFSTVCIREWNRRWTIADNQRVHRQSSSCLSCSFESKFPRRVSPIDDCSQRAKIIRSSLIDSFYFCFAFRQDLPRCVPRETVWSTMASQMMIYAQAMLNFSHKTIPGNERHWRCLCCSLRFLLRVVPCLVHDVVVSRQCQCCSGLCLRCRSFILTTWTVKMNGRSLSLSLSLHRPLSYLARYF